VNVKDVERFFAYDQWANRRLVAAAALIPPGDFTRELGASFGSLRGTLLHILWGERRWLQFWVDGSAIPDAIPDAFPDTAALSSSWAVLERERAAFVSELTDARLDAPLTVRSQQFQLRELIQHIANHSTYHRGQVALLLRQLGHTPPATDFRVFLVESR
jgi:uncharacterized damage-inducible protein DinB